MQMLSIPLRQLRRSPGFTSIAILTLALGMGANTALFSVVHRVLLRPLPYANSERLVRIASVNRALGVTDSRSSGLNVLDWQRQTRSFESIAAFQEWDGILTIKGKSHPTRVNWVTPNLIPMLGLKPVLGGLFPDEKAATTVLLPYRLWQNRFGSDPAVVGQTIIEDGEPAVVAGVLPPGVAAPGQGSPPLDQAFICAHLEKINYPRDWQLFNVIGRLKPGVSVAAAQAELSAVARELERLYPETNRGWSVRVTDLKQWMFAPVRAQLWIVYAATGVILLIASLNVSNLLLIRGTARRKDLAIRAALGSTRWQLLRPLLVEAGLLAIGGGLAGLLVAAGGRMVLFQFAPDSLGLPSDLAFSWPVLISTLLACVVAALVFGLFPAFRASRGHLQLDLTATGRSLSLEPSRHRLLAGAVSAQIGISAVLLITAGLALASFAKLARVDPGFGAHNAICFRVGVLPDRTTGERVFAALTNLPGVLAVGGSHIELLNDVFSNPVRITIDGQPALANASAPTVNFWLVTRDFFAAAQIPVLAGHTFTPRDNTNAPWLAVINEALAKQYFPNQNPIGRIIRIPDYKRGQPGRAREIVGVVGSVRQHGLREPAVPILYSDYVAFETGSVALIVRTAPNPVSLLPSIHAAVQKVDPALILTRVASAEQIVARSFAGDRFATMLMFAFAALGTLLAAVGLYGVLAYTVSQRRHEIGIRLALGAQKRQVLAMILRRAFLLTVLGLALGLAGAAGLGRFLRSVLFEVSPTDPVIFGTVSLLLVAVALTASWLPARRASRVDPIEALRCE